MRVPDLANGLRYLLGGSVTTGLLKQRLRCSGMYYRRVTLCLRLVYWNCFKNNREKLA